MSANSEIVSVSLPQKLAQEVKKSAKKLNRSRSQLFQEAISQYLWLQKWKEMQGYGVVRSREMGLVPGDVERLIAEYRNEAK